MIASSNAVTITLIWGSVICFVALVLGGYFVTIAVWEREPWWRHWRKDVPKPVMIEHLDHRNYREVVMSREYFQLPEAPLAEIEVDKDA